MLVTDKLVFVHLHKSGGTFVNELLLRCVPGARRIGYHLPYRELPAEYRGLPVLGTVRDPFAYYVSWYHFQRGLAQPNPLFAICSEEGTLDFAATVTNLATLHRDDARLARLEAAFPDHFRPHGINLTKACVRELGASGLGFYSFLYARMYAGAEAPRILRVESLRGELRTALEALGVLPDDTADRFLRQAPAMNTSRHGQPRDYYDEALAALVAREDAPVIARHGYRVQRHGS